MIDWTDPHAMISRNFTVRDAIWLNKWGRLAGPGDNLTDHVKEQILLMGNTMDKVRDVLGLPINVHRWFSPAGYNALVGGKIGSKHMCLGHWSAVDFDVSFRVHDLEDSCRQARQVLEPKLEGLGLRMERNDGGSWVHLDNAQVIHARYFKP
jgi:hypothetical protein